MTSAVDICNIALSEGATRTSINGFPPIDNSPAAVASKTYYVPKVQGLLRAANWAFARRQANLTLLRAAFINGVASTDPPSQPFQYEYLMPSDALKIRFIQQYQTTTTSGVPLTSAPSNTVLPAYAVTRVPYVIAADIDPTSHAPRKTILTNMQYAMAIYTADLSQYPDMWDLLFQSAATSTLAAYFIMTLAGDRALMAQQIQVASGILASARSANANESMSNIDHVPDWIQARMQSGGGLWNGNAMGGFGGDWDQMVFPDGLTY